MKPRGHLIGEMAALREALNTVEAVTIKDLAVQSGMQLRQVYRWVHAFESKGLIERFGRMPKRYRLKLAGSRLRKKGGE